jgi:hypothetical protein
VSEGHRWELRVVARKEKKVDKNKRKSPLFEGLLSRSEQFACGAGLGSRLG